MTKSIGMLLAGEVRPSDTRLALCGLDMGRPVVVVEERAPNADFAALAPMVERFLAKQRPPQIRSAAFTVAGPVRDGVSMSASIPWPVEGQALAAAFGIDRVSVVGEIEALAHAVPVLSTEDLLTLSEGDATRSGNQALISIGTCPGMAGLTWNGTDHTAFVSEGGHADFAPGNEDELRLALHLSQQVARVSVELLLSTSGLELIYHHLRSTSGAAEPEALAEAIQKDGLARSILRSAAAHEDAVCQRAIGTFLSIFGSTAGNLALTLRATGGVYLAGDMLSSLRKQLGESTFRDAFSRKPPMHDFLNAIRIDAVMNERAALLGAAAIAARDLRNRRVGGWTS